MTVTLQFNLAAPGVPANKKILGNNIEFAFNGDSLLLPTQSGYLGTASREGEFDPNFINKINALQPTSFRYPGGTYTDCFIWSGTLGPLNTRKYQESAFTRTPLSPDFGVGEMMSLAYHYITTHQNIDIIFNVNIVSGSAQLAADWVKQMNITRLTSSLFGITYPPVKYWEIGNEPYILNQTWPDLNVSTSLFVTRSNAFIIAMRAVDPTIKIGIPFSTGIVGQYTASTIQVGWNSTIVNNLTGSIDFAAVHNAYYPSMFLPNEVYNNNQLFGTVMAAYNAVVGDLNGMRQLFDAHPFTQNVPFAITEYNGYLFSQSNDPYGASLVDALYVADILRMMSYRNDIAFANFWSLSSNGTFGMIAANGSPRPTYYVYQAYFKLLRGSVIPFTIISGSTYTSTALGVLPSYSNIPTLDATITREGNLVQVMLINRDPTGSASVVLSPTNPQQIVSASLQTFGSDIGLFVTGDMSWSWIPITSSLTSSWSTVITVPSHSLAWVTLQLAPVAHTASVIWLDDFNRPDGAVGTALTGQSYFSSSGWFISSSYLKSTSSVPGTNIGGDIGQTDFVFSIVNVNGSNRPYWYFRYLDSNNYIQMFIYFSVLWVHKVVNGISTDLGSWIHGVQNDPTWWRFEFVGDSVAAYADTPSTNNSPRTKPIFTYNITDANLRTGTQFYIGTQAVGNNPIQTNLVILQPFLRPTTWIIDPNGGIIGDGTLTYPLRWPGAMLWPGMIQGDDQLLVRGGHHGHTSGTLNATISSSYIAPIIYGTPTHSIIISRYPQDVTTPNTFPHIHYQTNVISTQGWIDFLDLDFMGDDPTRWTGYDNPGPGSVSNLITVSFSIHASGSRIINCLSHDFASDGIDYWEDSPFSIMYGCYNYNNGFKDIYNTLPAGHGNYTQNDDSNNPHYILDCFTWNNYNYGLQAYGSSKASLLNYIVRGNTYFYTLVPGGSFAGGQSSQEFLFGGLGSTKIQNVVVDTNVMWTKVAGGLSFGYTGRHNSDFTCINNYLVAENFTSPININYFSSLIVSGNNFIGISMPVFGYYSQAPQTQTLITIDITGSTGFPTGAWQQNTYIVPMTASFALVTNVDTSSSYYSTMASWTAGMGWDSSSVMKIGAPTGSYVMVRPNILRPTGSNIPRAHITIVNWTTSSIIPVDVSNCLALNDTWALWHLFNWVTNANADGTIQSPKPPDQTGFYDGNPIQIKMIAPAPPTLVSNNISESVHDPLQTPGAGRPGCYVLVQTGNTPPSSSVIRPRPPGWKQNTK